MVPGSLSIAQLMFVSLSQPLQSYAYDCSIFGSWHIGFTACLLSYWEGGVHGESSIWPLLAYLYITIVQTPNSSGWARDNFRQPIMLLRHPKNIWFSQDLKIFILFGTQTDFWVQLSWSGYLGDVHVVLLIGVWKCMGKDWALKIMRSRNCFKICMVLRALISHTYKYKIEIRV